MEQWWDSSWATASPFISTFVAYSINTLPRKIKERKKAMEDTTEESLMTESEVDAETEAEILKCN
jgi:hypothetical protein